jgi:hypothetical protein
MNHHVIPIAIGVKVILVVIFSATVAVRVDSEGLLTEPLI